MWLLQHYAHFFNGVMEFLTTGDGEGGSSVSSYGSSYGSYSACNSYAFYPPILVDGDNNIRGLLSVDKYDSDSVCYFSFSDSCQLLEFYCGL